MKSTFECHLGAWDMQVLNQRRKRLPVASWLIEQGELLGEIMYILGQGLGCVCFVIFVVWESLFGERHPPDEFRRRIEEEREQSYFQEQRRLYKLRYGNLLERRASASNTDELAQADQYRSKCSYLLTVDSAHGAPLDQATYENMELRLHRDQCDLEFAKKDILYWRNRPEHPDAAARLAQASSKEDELKRRIEHMEKEFNKVAMF